MGEPVEQTKDIEFKVGLFGQAIVATADQFRVAKIQTHSPAFVKTSVEPDSGNVTHWIKQVDHVVNELRQPFGPQVALCLASPVQFDLLQKVVDRNVRMRQRRTPFQSCRFKLWLYSSD